MKIDVEFYDDTEELSFKNNYPNEYAIYLNSGTPLDIPIEDFKTYFLFRAQIKDPKNIFKGFSQELIRKWPHFKDYFVYHKATGNFNVAAKPDGMTEISEGLGVAGALSVASTIFLGGTQADWRKIPVQTTRDFDFKHIASNSQKYFEVEAKGCITKDNRLKVSSVSNHKKSIKDKKNDNNFKSKYTTATDCFFGVITCADGTNRLKAYLVDPPAMSVEMTPYKYRVLSRLYYYHDFTHYISNRSYISIILANRIKAIEAINDINLLNSSPLVNSNFDKITITESFIGTRSFADIDDKRYIGKCEADYKIIKGQYITQIVFIGIALRIYDILISQDFDTLLSYKDSTATVRVRLTCKIRDDGAVRNVMQTRGIEGKDGYFSFYADTEVTIASSGLIYGIIQPEEISRISIF